MKFCLAGVLVAILLSTSYITAQETINSPSKKLYGHEKDVSSLAVSPDGKYLASGSWKNNVILWNLDSFKQVWKFKAHKSTVEKIDFGPDSRYFVSCSNDANAHIWDAKKQTKSLTLPGHRSNINDAKFNDNYKGNEGRFVATATKSGLVRIFDREDNGKLLRKIEVKNASADAVAFGPNGKFILVACGDNKIRTYNFLKGDQTRKFKAHKDKINELKLSPGGMEMVTASNDQTAKIWNYAKGNQKQNLKGHTWRVLAADYSSNGKYVATGSNDNSARLWKTNNGEQVRIFKPKGRDYIRAIAITPNNQYVITGSLVRKDKDAALLFWKTGMGGSK